MAVTGKNTQNSPGMRALIKRIGKKKAKPIEKEEKNMTNHHSLSYRLRGNQSLRLKRQEPRILHKKPHPRMLLTQDTAIYLCE
jgi:5'-3' exonuclease